VAHGGFVLDTPDDWPEFQKRSRKKPKDPFKDLREIQRLTHRVSDLYRRSVLAVVRQKLEVDWSATGV
jgi:hypothetical protein